MAFPKENNHQTHTVLDLIHTDVCGPIRTVTPSQKRYILTIIHDSFGYSTVYLMKQKIKQPNLLKNSLKWQKRNSERN